MAEGTLAEVRIHNISELTNDVGSCEWIILWGGTPDVPIWGALSLLEWPGNSALSDQSRSASKFLYDILIPEKVLQKAFSQPKGKTVFDDATSQTNLLLALEILIEYSQKYCSNETCRLVVESSMEPITKSAPHQIAHYRSAPCVSIRRSSDHEEILTSLSNRIMRYLKKSTFIEVSEKQSAKKPIQDQKIALNESINDRSTRAEIELFWQRIFQLSVATPTIDVQYHNHLGVLFIKAEDKCDLRLAVRILSDAVP